MIGGNVTFTPAEQRIIDAYPTGTMVDLPLNEEQRTVRGDVLARLLTNGFELPGSLRPALKVTGARITGILDLDGVSVNVPIELRQCLFEEVPSFEDAELRSFRLPGTHLPGLHAAGVRTKYDLDLSDGFVSTGEVNLLGAHIGGTLRLHEALLYNPGGRALVGSRIVVDGAFLSRALTAVGQVRLISARVRGLLSFSAANLSAPGKIALQAERLEVGESLFLTNGFRVNGRVVFQGAQIGGGIDAVNARFSAPPGVNCFNVVRTRVGLNAVLRGASFTSNVAASTARVGGHFTFENTSFDEGARVDLQHVGAMRLKLTFATPPHRVVLTAARVEILEDDPEKWPAELRLRDFTYDFLHSIREVTPAGRLNWLERDYYRPRSYLQLANTYRSMGQERSARGIALALQRRRRPTLPRPARLAGYLLDVTVGYGYRTWLAGLWLALFVVIGGIVFSIWPAERAEAWRPTAATQWFGSTLILLGWSLTTAVIAGFTRLFTRTSY